MTVTSAASMLGSILVVDNDTVYLDILAEYLGSLGYHVLTADSAARATSILAIHNIHLVLVDVRLREDTDDKDRSGVRFARDVARTIPKIVLTKYPRPLDVRDAMKLDSWPLPAAIDFVNKIDGLEAIRDVVQQAFQDHVCINRDLQIINRGNPALSFDQIAFALEPGVSDEALPYRASEVDDLFGKFFLDSRQVRLDRVLWRTGHRVALTAFNFIEGRPPEFLALVCGPHAEINEEARRYHEFAPSAPGTSDTILRGSSSTLHFALNAYSLSGADAEDLRHLAELYDSSPEPAFRGAINSLFSRTLSHWHQDRSVVKTGGDADEWFRQRLGLTPQRLALQNVADRLARLAAPLPAVGMAVGLEPSLMTLGFGRHLFSHPNPANLLATRLESGLPVLFDNLPGSITGDNVLASLGGNTWLTDFGNSGVGPTVWPLASLEALIRFDWCRCSDLTAIYEMEGLLVNGEPRRVSPGQVDSALRKPLRSIISLRRHVVQSTGDQAAYRHLLFLLTMHRLLELDPAIDRTRGELVRVGHLLLAAAIMARHLTGVPPSGLVGAGIRLDPRNQTVLLNETPIPLRGNSYRLLLVLYEDAGRLCTRKQLIEQALGEKFDERDMSQIARLNVAIRRLREKIEANPDQPQYVQSVPGGGYRLVPH